VRKKNGRLRRTGWRMYSAYPSLYRGARPSREPAAGRGWFRSSLGRRLPHEGHINSARQKRVTVGAVTIAEEVAGAVSSENASTICWAVSPRWDAR